MKHLNLISVVEEAWGISRLSVDPKSVFIKSLNTCPHVKVGLICLEEVPNFRII